MAANEGSGRGRGHRPTERVTRRSVVDAASRVARQGINALTMSKVASELDVTSMALYQHVRDKAHLVQLLVEDLLIDVDVPLPSAGSWDVRLRTLHLAVTEAMAAYPGLLAVNRDSPQIPRLLEGYLLILLDAGFDPLTAARAYTGLYHLAVGAVEGTTGGATPAAVNPPAGYPASATVAAAAADAEAADLREFALDVYIRGLRALLAENAG